MPVLRTATVIDAPLPTVAAAVRDVGVLERTAAATGCATAGTGGPRWLGAGDEVPLRLRLAPGVGLPLRLRAVTVTLDRLRSTAVAGPLPTLVHTSVLAPAPVRGTATSTAATGAGTLLTDEVEWACAGGRAADVLVGRRVAAAVLRRHRQQVRARAEELAGAAEVVAAAVIDRHGRVLAQQRAYPAAVAGRWELPGGRVEPGESARDALVRECTEELAVAVLPGAQLGPDVPLPGGRVLRVYRAALADPAARPVPVEHSALRWLGAAELGRPDWLDADRAVLPDLELALRGS